MYVCVSNTLYKSKIITGIKNYSFRIYYYSTLSTIKENAANAYSGSVRSWISFPISCREALFFVTIPTYNRRVNVSCEKSASPERISEWRPRERKSPLGFRGIIEDDVSILDGGSVVTRGPRFSRSLVVNMHRIPRAWTSWRDIGSHGTDNLAGGRPWSRALVPRISLTPINRSFFFEPTAPAFSHVVYDLAGKPFGIISIMESSVNIFFRDTCLLFVCQCF